MRGKPIHSDPSVHPLRVNGHPLQDGWPAQAAGAPAEGAASSSQTLGNIAPQVTVDHSVAGHIKSQVAKQREELLKTNPMVDRATEEQLCLRWINDAVALWSDAQALERGVNPTPAEDDALRRGVYDLLFRAGWLQPYLDDPDVEDIFIQGHDEVWLDYGNGQRKFVGAIADSEEELLELLRELARESGHSERTISTANPLLALALPDGSRLQAITDVSPMTYAVIRRHRVEHANLNDMMQLGTIDPILKEFLAACVRAEKNVMIAGKQRSAKPACCGRC